MSEPPARGDEGQNGERRQEELRLVREFLDVQRDELQIRRDEVEVQRDAGANNYQYALLALAANERDRDSSRSFLTAQLKHRLVFFGFVVVVFATILTIALVSGSQQIALEMVKIVGYMTAGGAGGYALGYLRRSRKDDQDSMGE